LKQHGFGMNVAGCNVNNRQWLLTLSSDFPLALIPRQSFTSVVSIAAFSQHSCPGSPPSQDS